MLKDYIRSEDMTAARQVLHAAAFTYVASALVSLIDVTSLFTRFDRIKPIRSKRERF